MGFRLFSTIEDESTLQLNRAKEDDRVAYTKNLQWGASALSRVGDFAIVVYESDGSLECGEPVLCDY